MTYVLAEWMDEWNCFQVGLPIQHQWCPNFFLCWAFDNKHLFENLMPEIRPFVERHIDMKGSDFAVLKRAYLGRPPEIVSSPHLRGSTTVQEQFLHTRVGKWGCRRVPFVILSFVYAYIIYCKVYIYIYIHAYFTVIPIYPRSEIHWGSSWMLVIEAHVHAEKDLRKMGRASAKG